MVLYPVLTLKGIFQAAIKGAPFAWLGLSLLPHNGFQEVFFLAFHCLLFLQFLNYAALWLGLSQVPHVGFFHALASDPFLLHLGVIIVLLIDDIYPAQWVSIPFLDSVFATWLLKTYILQYTQGIPATQPDRSPSRTPPREGHLHDRTTSVPPFHGPIHHALHTQCLQQPTWPQPWTNQRPHVLTPMTQPTPWKPFPPQAKSISSVTTRSSSSTTPIVRTIGTYTFLHNVTEIFSYGHSISISIEGQPRLPNPTLRNPSNDQLEAGRGFSRRHQDKRIRLSVYHPLQQI